MPLEVMTQAEKEEREVRQRMTRLSNPKFRTLAKRWHGWVSDAQWQGLAELAQIAPFNKPDLVDQMIKNTSEWEKFISEPDSY